MTVEIRLAGARVRYGPLEALHGVDLPVPAGRLTVLTGRNGSGRSTALRALAGTVTLSAGRVLWRGTDVTRLPAYARARRGMCLTPDTGAVFASLTVAENLALAGGDPSPALTAYPALARLLPRRAGTLSGGEQRMLAVSRALLSPARLLLFDEPAQGMSADVAARTHALLGELARAGRTVVVAEQSLPPKLAAAASVVHELRRGTVVFSGEPQELRGA
ncbi:High-affinity branched-chain amino acid transport ATP-binding protein LivF [Streptomyces sp. RB5]|uniref:High-affinity branched-chain amino acid transport ATP-binding protein LivF n=1 Tax=Streptomyces smaragdinus TaxID=2585196 RepID=A0A7K0CJE9_9ACTN|nr:ATP-binding cassette domain-containing protein [Streptomyces smaragdinus]MQY13162.1 High-affinity branched-chain amino acid transport ATP-binding protein LivF [Streptomyces smaragdinus]